ncbi:hypothetical protein AB1N83_011199 [Pleurotus pulmonarius]
MSPWPLRVSETNSHYRYRIAALTRDRPATMDRSRPVRPVTLTGSEIVLVARVAVNALRGLGLECVLVGGAACGAFGSSLIAKNVDIVVLSADVGREEIKRRMAARDSNFFLASPETPHATYKVLWYDISPTSVARSPHSPPIIRMCRDSLWAVTGWNTASRGLDSVDDPWKINEMMSSLP